VCVLFICKIVFCVLLQADSINLAGSTPLHFACQYCPPGKTFTIVKLLQHKAGILILNKEGDSAFDMAVRFNRKGINIVVSGKEGGREEREGERGKEGRKLIYFILLYPEAVALLVDAEPKLLRNIKTVLEAAKKGQPHPHLENNN
jgi:hypothetical protein